MKIAVDLGHGCAYDRGAVGIIAEESAINEVGNILIRKLRERGHNVIEVRPSSASSTSNSLYQRYNKANVNEVDVFVSLHDNAGRGLGTEVYTYKGAKLDKANRYLAKMSALGFRNRGVKDGSRLAVVNGTNMEALLFEGFFVDRQEDVDLYRRLDKEKLANALFYGITGEDLDVVKPQPQPQPQPQGSVYRVRNSNNDPKSQVGAYKQLDGAKKIADQHKLCVWEGDKLVYNSQQQNNIDFKIYMKCHAQGIGDMSTEGTNFCEVNPNENRQIEGFALDIDKVDFSLQAHIQNMGDDQELPKGFYHGSFHQARRLEAIKIKVNSIPQGYKLLCQGYVLGKGWTDWKGSNEWVGTRGEGLALGHIKVKIEKC